MAYGFFYLSFFVMWAAFAVVSRIIRPDIRSLVIGIATAGYSVTFDMVFGVMGGLYHYISPPESSKYIVLSALLIYPFINIIYTSFLPQKPKRAVYYTALWIAGMLLFEYLSVKSGTIVFTGWRPVPWSIITYIITFAWIYSLYTNMSRRFTPNPKV